MNATLLAPSTVLATFTVEELDGDLPTIEIRPRVSPAGYSIKGFDVYHRDNNTDIGADTALGAIEAALAAADAMGWEGFTLTADGLDVLAAEAVDNYRYASPLEQDVEEIVEECRRNRWVYWPKLGATDWPAFEARIRHAFAA